MRFDISHVKYQLYKEVSIGYSSIDMLRLGQGEGQGKDIVYISISEFV